MYLQTHLPDSLKNEITKVIPKNKVLKIAKKKSLSFLKIYHLKVKVFVWNLSPLHWFDDMKDIKIELDQFQCKK